MTGELPVAGICIKLPDRPAPDARSFLQHRWQQQAVVKQQLRRSYAFDFRQQICLCGNFADMETTTTDIHPCQTVTFMPGILLLTGDGHQHTIRTFFKQGFITDRTRRYDSHNLAVDRTLAGRRITNLLTDCHRASEFHQACQVAFR